MESNEWNILNGNIVRAVTVLIVKLEKHEVSEK